MAARSWEMRYSSALPTSAQPAVFWSHLRANSFSSSTSRPATKRVASARVRSRLRIMTPSTPPVRPMELLTSSKGSEAAILRRWWTTRTAML